MENPEIGNLSLRKQGAWLLFAKVVGFGFTFLLPLLIVRFLSQENVGIYRQAFQVIVNATAVLPLGFSMSAYYFLSRSTGLRRASTVFNILIFNFAVGGIACLTLFLFPQLIGNIFQSEEMTRLAPLIGLVIWLSIFSSFLETIGVANQETLLSTAFIILAQFTKTVFMVSAVMIFATVEAFIYAALIQGALQTLVLIVYLKSRFPAFWRAFDPGFFREHLIYALPLGLAALLWTLQTDIHNYFVGYRFTPAEYAIYAYGCFQLPLISMISESVTSVLIPRMSQLQARNDKREMLRLTGQSMQKLAFFFFPIYIFLVITAETFVTTLFSKNYAASTPIFLINLTLLPFYVWINDPIVRAFKELGRFYLFLQMFLVGALIAALYFGIQYFDLRGMITIVVIATLTGKLITTTVIVRKLEVKLSDLHFLKPVGQTAISAIAAGIVTVLFYWQLHDRIAAFGSNLAKGVIGFTKTSVVDFVSGVLILTACFLVFTPIYLITANYFGIIDDDEKKMFSNLIGRIFRSGNPEKQAKISSVL
ncbi:MAG: oligosaccharide flippase family protein [Saprospiraceae bacterium]|nr:oligosaccharide flippase family protein [Pyrinomonadaceae bacterium]